jgi:hypothetical protein
VPRIRHSTTVERRIEDLAVVLGARPADWLQAFARIAVHTAEAAVERDAGTRGRGRRADRHVSIDLTDAPPDDDTGRIDATVRWTNDGFRWVFSSFDGRLVARRGSPTTSEIVLEGTLRYPDDATDPIARDRAHAAADAAIQQLLLTLRHAFEEEARANV